MHLLNIEGSYAGNLALQLAQVLPSLVCLPGNLLCINADGDVRNSVCGRRALRLWEDGVATVRRLTILIQKTTVLVVEITIILHDNNNNNHHMIILTNMINDNK